MADALNTSISGLHAAERSIATASHNIANANTPGYSRQRNIQVPNLPQQYGRSYLGRGVETVAIQRTHNQFIESQVQSQSTELNRVASFNSMAVRMDQLMSGVSLNATQTEFFNALEDAANNPHSAAHGQQILSAAKNLASQFNYLDGQLVALQQDINNGLDQEVMQINSLANSIYDINQQISTHSVSAQTSPNDLLDQRDLLLQELAGRIDITTYDHGNYGIDVAIGSGIPLVSIAGVRPLTTVTSEANPRIRTIAIPTESGLATIASQLGGGTMGGLLEFSRDVLVPVKNEIGLMAAVTTHQINSSYAAAQQQPDARLFEIAEIRAFPGRSNVGTAQASAQILDTSLVSASDYYMQFDGSEYTLTRLSDNTRVTGPAPLLVDGIQFEVSPGAVAGDVFMISPAGNAAATLKVANVEASSLTMLHPQDGQSVPLAQTLAALRDERIFDHQTATLTEQYAGLIINIGSVARNSDNQLQSMQQIFDDTMTRHDSQAAVSLDEEAAMLLQYQRAYEASARVISLSSTMFDTLINALNRM